MAMIPVILIWPNPEGGDPKRRHMMLPCLPDAGHRFIPPDQDEPLHVLTVEWDARESAVKIFIVLN